MTAEPPPTGWLSVEEAARITGHPEAPIRTAARRIKPTGSYTIYGWPLGWIGAPADLPAMPGDQLKRLHRGRIILNRDMVMVWKEACDRIAEVRAAGGATLAEIAAKHGVTVAEVRRVNKRIEEEEHISDLQQQGRTIDEIAQLLKKKPAFVRRRLQEKEDREKRMQQNQRANRS